MAFLCLNFSYFAILGELTLIMGVAFLVELVWWSYNQFVCVSECLIVMRVCVPINRISMLQVAAIEENEFCLLHVIFFPWWARVDWLGLIGLVLLVGLDNMGRKIQIQLCFPKHWRQSYIDLIHKILRFYIQVSSY